MNDSIEFRFVTRTLNDDYHVYADDGGVSYSDQTEFAPLRKICSINSEDGGCAALFEDAGKIFLVASGLSTGRKDVAGRPVRFSFCEIFQGNGQNDRENSFAAFTRLTTQWTETESKIQSFFRELEKGVFFDQKKFIEWLQADRQSGVNFETCKHGHVRTPKNFIWPSSGCMIKWLYFESDTVVCVKLSINRQFRRVLLFS